jgi:hypothetical protein
VTLVVDVYVGEMYLKVQCEKRKGNLQLVLLVEQDGCFKNVDC